MYFWQPYLNVVRPINQFTSRPLSKTYLHLVCKPYLHVVCLSAQPLRGLSVSRYLHVVYLSILPPRGLSVSRTSTWSICQPYLHVAYLLAVPPRGLSVNPTSTWSICKPYLHMVYLSALSPRGLSVSRTSTWSIWKLESVSWIVWKVWMSPLQVPLFRSASSCNPKFPKERDENPNVLWYENKKFFVCLFSWIYLLILPWRGSVRRPSGSAHPFLITGSLSLLTRDEGEGQGEGEEGCYLTSYKRVYSKKYFLK